jgi:hypothetical protein
LEYLIGAIVTTATILLTYRWFMANSIPKKSFKVSISQSRTNELMKSFFIKNESFPAATTQSMKHFDSINLRILILEEQAYWIKNNAVFVAEVINGEIEKDTAKEVDTMAMDKVQLNKLMFIVEKLKEGL